MNKPALVIPPQEPVKDDAPVLKARELYNCTMCRHFDQPIGTEPPDGRCLRYPPTVLLIGMQPHPISNQMQPVTHQFVPTVGPMFCCGEFAAKPEDLQ